MQSVAAVALRVNHQSMSNNLFSRVADGTKSNVAAVELMLEDRFKALLRYCAAQQLSTADLKFFTRQRRST